MPASSRSMESYPSSIGSEEARTLSPDLVDDPRTTHKRSGRSSPRPGGRTTPRSPPRDGGRSPVAPHPRTQRAKAKAAASPRARARSARLPDDDKPIEAKVESWRRKSVARRRAHNEATRGLDSQLQSALKELAELKQSVQREREASEAGKMIQAALSTPRGGGRSPKSPLSDRSRPDDRSTPRGGAHSRADDMGDGSTFRGDSTVAGGDRTDLAESVMRKLYLRNVKLEKRVLELMEQLEKSEAVRADESVVRSKVTAATAATSAARKAMQDEAARLGIGGLPRADSSFSVLTSESRGDTSLDTIIAVHKQQEAHLNRLLRDRDATISALRREVDEARAGGGKAPEGDVGEQLAALKKDNAVLNEEISNLDAQLRGALADAERFHSSYVHSRQELRKVLKERAGEVKQLHKMSKRHMTVTSGSSSGRSSRSRSRAGAESPRSGARSPHPERVGMVMNAAKKLIKALTTRLSVVEREQQEESSAYFKKLAQAEKANADWFVERKLMEGRVAELAAQIRERDELMDKMELCVHSLFEKLKESETKNARLTVAIAEAIGEVPSADSESKGDETPRLPRLG